MPRKANTFKSSSPPAERALRHATFLCLLCRQVGHVMKSRPYLPRRKHQNESSGWALPTDPEAVRLSTALASSPSPTTTSSPQSLCERCKHLNIISVFTDARPFTLDDNHPDHAERATRKLNQIRTLGPITTLQLLSTCAICCLIFDITFLTDDDLRDSTSVSHGPKCHLVLALAWTINRLERYVQWPGYAKGEGLYAKCLYTYVRKSYEETYARTILVDWAMDAVGLEGTREGVRDGSGVLALKEVDLNTADYDMIRGWLRRCDDLHHITCQPAWSEDLRKIKLIDVEARQVVIYPSSGCDYITLSYVWGGVRQRSYELGDVLPTASLPATIEDAMVVTRNLGKQYLWVDSLCIEQDNEAEKVLQIGIMSAIYNGAWATLICVSGQSAQSGMPRVGASRGIIPQLTCKIGGRRLLSVMPTLSRQLSQSPWTKRGWTYQEGLLSPRCIFFTRHQVYFECNSTQSCESLDDSSSPFHLQSDEQRRSSLDKNLPACLDNGLDDGTERTLGQGVLRDPFRALSTAHWTPANDDNTLVRYMKLVHAYTSKKMTHDSDAVHAFSAVLAHLAETDYKKGFLYGLPVQELPRALLWTHANQPRRRSSFPAWSWAGWEGTVKPILPKGARSLHLGWEDLPPLRAWKSGADGRPELIYDFDPIQWIEGRESDDPEHSDDSGSQESDVDADDGDSSNESGESGRSLGSNSEDDRESAIAPHESTESLDCDPWVRDASSSEGSGGETHLNFVGLAAQAILSFFFTRNG
ncbi:hypothetical protein PAXRUDRAFT_640599 [Paxillus rubicundulus Ve08.2h10]|uniref:Heterokaryon incompatibility domain-containing protein n=1 Tax=Paxillus rubicundulus Ve08.2h10 TaxID=930991 RepID=A0A0D0E2V2_9AGAM|nr:hypothetical protein PAXRUDRAFT_640599 [Paxillus rubicundulus Ve08.2h10]